MPDMTTILIEAAGWGGALLCLSAYMLLSSGRVTAQSASFQAMNAIGAAGFVVNTAWHGAIPSVVLNIIWAGTGAHTLWRIAQKKRALRSE